MPACLRRHPRRAFSLVELLVVIAVLGILALILIPVVARVRASAQSAHCVSNLQQLGHAFALHAEDHRGCLPAPVDLVADRAWYEAIHPYTGTPWSDDLARLAPVFQCPTWTLDGANIATPDNIGYSMSAAMGPGHGIARPIALAGLTQPSRTVLLLERSGPGSIVSPVGDMSLEAFGTAYSTAFDAHGCDRHAGSANYLFADGHVGHHTPQEAAGFLK